MHPVSTDDEERPAPTLRPSTPADLQNLSEDEVAGLLRQTLVKGACGDCGPPGIR